MIALIVCLLQSPGEIAADTKLDLTANPLGFLARAAHLWTPNAPMGQVQNQAYGYFFPHGAFFAVGDLLSVPPWIVQRLWWALLLVVGFVGIVRVAEALRIGSPASRVFAGIVFVLSPRVLTTLGSISSETLPMMLAPWVLLPVIRALDDPGLACGGTARPLWWEAARSAAAVALMGAVNAVATAAALGVAAVWWLLHRPRDGRWWRFGAWTTLGLVFACAWWIVPLLLLSRVSPPFLDYIESSRVTTEWTSLTEVLRGASSWTPFVSPERVAGAVLVTQPAAVLATGTIAAAGLAGLCMRHMPFRGRLVTILVIGLLVMCTGYVGGLDSPVAEQVRTFLDGSGAPLRNIHKFEPFVRLPLVLGVAHLLARVPLPGTASARETLSAFAHPQRSRPVAAAIVLLVAVIASGSLMWTGQIAPAGTYRAIPDHWRQAANWLSEHSERPDGAPPARTLVVPGAPFADQLWGLTRDEPLQPLADAPWAVRDAIPLTPPGAIRALDAVQREIAAGRGSPGLAATLAQQGIGYVVLRADLDPETSRSTRPLLAQQALDTSPGLTRVATFGPEVGPPSVRGVVRDNGLRPKMPAIQIYAVDPDGLEGPTFDGTGPLLVDRKGMTRVAGGPEAVAELAEVRAREGRPQLGPVLLDADARRAGITDGPLVVTDTPADRETDFGRVDDHSSAIRAAGDPRRTQNAAPDYPVDGQPLVRGEWLLDNAPGEVEVTTSGSASDAVQPGQTSPANSPAAAFDGNPQTAWVSGGLEGAVGRWLRIGFTTPQSDLAVTLTTAKALGPDVTSVLVTTEAGSTVVSGLKPGKATTVTAPSGPTRWLRIRALSTDDGTAGNQFALGEVSVTNLRTSSPLQIRYRVTLPDLEAGTPVAQWLLYSELNGRAWCVDDPAREIVRCAPGLGLSPETGAVFTRALSVPEDTTVTPTVILRPRPGDALDRLLAEPGSLTATGPRPVGDPRGNPGAAVDGDPGTSWTAPQIPETERAADDSDERDEETGKSDENEPTLVVRLPARQRVESLKLHAPQDYPARPSEVSVDLGTGEQIREVGRDGVLRLDPAVTDRIEITIREQAGLIDVNSLGFATPAPPGIAEVEVFPAPAPPADPDRVVEIGCDDGIGITAAGQVVGVSARTTAGALRSGEPVVGTPCANGELRLPAGRQEVAVNPGEAFTVDAVSLVHEPLTPATTSVPTVAEWGATHRVVDVDAGPERLLVVPESTNPGWIARLDGTELSPVVVDGWQQGWIVPEGASGRVDLTYRFDSLYRWSIVVGLAMMAALLLAAWWPSKRRVDVPARQTPAPGRATLIAAGAGILGTSWLLSGWWGLAIGVVAGIVAAAMPHRAGVTTTFVAMMAATTGLAAGPWHAEGGYHGWQWWVQLPALVAVLMTCWIVFLSTWAAPSTDDAATDDAGDAGASAAVRLRRRASRLRSQLRAGSSMNA